MKIHKPDPNYESPRSNSYPYILEVKDGGDQTWKPIIHVRIYKGTSIISKLIQFQSDGPYSHSAIVFGDTVYEAKEFKGVQKHPITDDVGSVYDDFAVDMTVEQVDILMKFLEAQMGKKYSYGMIARFITRKQVDRKASQTWFCSELVFAALQKAGVELFARTEPWFVSPNLLVRSTLLKTHE